MTEEKLSLTGHRCGRGHTPYREQGTLAFVDQRLHSKVRRYAAAWMLFILLAAHAGCRSSAFGQDQKLVQMLHTSWTGRDGAPQDINALAQTPDGTLWIGSTGGLFSFDGLTFTPFQPKPGQPHLPSNAIASLLVSKDGDLWVEGIYVASVARISNGRVTLYDQIEGQHADKLANLQQDSEGVMWAVVEDRRLVRLGEDKVWHPSQNPTTAIRGFIGGLFLDSAGTMWVIEDERVYRRPKGEVRFQATDSYAKYNVHFIEDSDHGVWVAGQHHNADAQFSGAERIVGSHGTSGKRLPFPLNSLRVNDMLGTPDEHLWMAMAGRGIVRASLDQLGKYHGSKDGLDMYASQDGLSSNHENVLLRDADGNIWVGGSRGLDRFTPSQVVPAIGGAAEGAWSTCTNPQGEVWLSSDDGQLSVIKEGKKRQIYKGDPIFKLYCGRKGDVWFMDKSGLQDFYMGRSRRLSSLPGHPPNPSGDWNFVALLELSDHELLASEAGVDQTGLWAYAHGRWKQLVPTGELPYVIAMVRDQNGRLYLGRIDGKVSVLSNGLLHTFPTRPPSIGVIATLSQTSRNLFALGSNGIAVLRGDSFQMLSFVRPELAYTVSGLVESRNGDIWINGSGGIVRIPSTEISAALTDPNHMINGEAIHEGDFVGPATWWKPTPSAIMDVHGKLWFSTLNGVVSIDPGKGQRASHPPQLAIRSITVNGHQIEESRVFPPKPQAFDIRYFGINLTNPDKVIYRYRLDGFDETWQDVGRRTEAIYTGLGPGTYTFRVMASNGDGLWTAPISSVRFRVSPHFYQTWWFITVCVLGGAILLWFAFTIRLRFVSGAIRMRAEERADERIRIARELHDTLLQGVQGLLLSFHVAAQRVSADDESRKLLERALTTADRLTIEGRNRVSSLRSEHLADGELLAALQGVKSDLSSDQPINCLVTRSGSDATLQAHVVDEIFNIAREALTNAFRHSEATQITMELNYRKRAFSMTCRDNGKGFEAQALQETNSAGGHWGLRGMRERAEKINGKISWISTSGQGTTVQIIIPSFRAYQRKHGIRSFLLGRIY